MIRIMCLGDVVGSEGISFLRKNGRLGKLKAEYKADLVIANGENSDDRNGMSRQSAEELRETGVDLITGGNHTWKLSDVYGPLDDCGYLVRPANFPGEAPGMGYRCIDVNGSRVLVINVLGTVFMDPVAPPAVIIDKILKSEPHDVAVCDVHAESTSEKLFIARYFDGRLSAVFGTHTHVQTSDAAVLPGGTGYITDLGMCGSGNGILGVNTEDVIHKFTVQTPVRFRKAEGNCSVQGAVFEIDGSTGRCVSASSFVRS